MGSTVANKFSAPAEEVTFSGCLFDMDGTIIDSTEAVEKHWHTLTAAAEQRIGKELGVDPLVILQTSHGRRSIDVLKDLDPSKANWEYISHVEGQIPKLYGTSAVEIPGARSLLSTLLSLHTPWAIVTSGTMPLVSGWLSILKLPRPEHLIVAEDVPNGKPDPAGYLMGLRKLGLADKAGQVLVLEDSPAGIRAGKAAGCKVLGVVTSHTVEQVVGSGPDWVVRDLESVKAVKMEGGIVTLEIRNAYVA